MPALDGRGPLCQGPQTGRGLGSCNPDANLHQRVIQNPRRGLGRGLGPGGGRGLGHLNQSLVSVGQPGQFFTYGPPR